MADIKSLLNPIPDHSGPRKHLSSGLTLGTRTRELSPPSTPRKKPKLSKDAAVFIRGEIQGNLNYPPFEERDALLLAQHQQHELYPMEHIADYPRHIPYNSEKKSFLEKTGRESFEVFQYEFKVPGEEKVYCMMWDYNIGLVRTTALFKCTGYSKTTPAKMLNRNPGLRDICHSITGGALVAQGYWMPYEAARAVAATFCWRIRYALTPVFGPDFPSMCTPTDSENFAEMVIDPAVTRLCTQKAKEYRAIEGHLSRGSSVLPSPATPDSLSISHFSKHLQSAGVKAANCTRDHETESTTEKNYALSSLPTYDGVWTPANTPRTVSTVDTNGALPSPRDGLVDTTDSAPFDSARLGSECSSNSSSSVSDQRVCKHCSGKRDYETDGSAISASTDDADETELPLQHSKTTQNIHLTSADEKAAYSLMSMRMAFTDLNDNSCFKQGLQVVRGRKRRASA